MKCATKKQLLRKQLRRNPPKLKLNPNPKLKLNPKPKLNPKLKPKEKVIVNGGTSGIEGGRFFVPLFVFLETLPADQSSRPKGASTDSMFEALTRM